MIFLCPPGATIDVDVFPPHRLRCTFSTPNALSPVGLAAVAAHIAGYLTTPKRAQIASEMGRLGDGVGGYSTSQQPSTVANPAPIAYVPVENMSRQQFDFPVLAADLLAEIAAIQAVVNTAGNALGNS